MSTASGEPGGVESADVRPTCLDPWDDRFPAWPTDVISCVLSVFVEVTEALSRSR